MADIIIKPVNEVWMKIICSEIHMELDIQDRFSFEVPGAKWDMRVKKGHWDGIKKLYNRKNKTMYVGLLFELLKFCKRQKFTVDIDPRLLPQEEQLDDEDLQNLIEFINPHHEGKPITPYDYQIEAVKYMLNMQRSTCLAATSAGKSLILYLAVRIYQLVNDIQDKKIFIVVPTKSLVEQMFSDFNDYSNYTGSEWHVNRYCQRVSGKHAKNIEKQIVITTWQSWARMPAWVYEDVGAVFVDEVHTAKAEILSKLLESCTQTHIRHGLTGTLDDIECNELVIQGLLGPSKRIITAKELMDQGRAAKIAIKILMLKHGQAYRKELFDTKKGMDAKRRYQFEVDYINSNKERRKTINSLVNFSKGNTLVLFDKVETYGKEIHQEFVNEYPDRPCYIVIGDTEDQEREEIRKIMETHDDAVIYASFGVFSTGISIKKLHNLFVISSTKSKIRILQSIGRLMRLHSSKGVANIIDIVDDLTYENEQNYSMNHVEERIKFYSNENFDIKFDSLELKTSKRLEGSLC